MIKNGVEMLGFHKFSVFVTGIYSFGIGVLLILRLIFPMSQFSLFEHELNTVEFWCKTAIDCNSNGNCTLGQCMCFDGFTGNICENVTQGGEGEIEYVFYANCSDVYNCMNDGICYHGACVCVNGFSGDICEINSCLNESITFNCHQNNDCSYGTTVVGECTYGICVCNPNYYGDNCELERRDLSFCNVDDECLSGGKCFLNDNLNGECYCPHGTIGLNCET